MSTENMSREDAFDTAVRSWCDFDYPGRADLAALAALLADSERSALQRADGDVPAAGANAAIQQLDQAVAAERPAATHAIAKSFNGIEMIETVNVRFHASIDHDDPRVRHEVVQTGLFLGHECRDVIQQEEDGDHDPAQQ